MQIGLLGYGVVGAGVDHLAKELDGLDVRKVLCLNLADVTGGRGVTDIAEIVDDPEIDTVVEAMGGLHPAWEFASSALRAGKNYITANKALVAAYLPELLELAQANGAALRCTAAVGGGIPWLINLERCRRVDTVRRIWGVFNGTTNFILDAMHRQGADYAEALATAQKLGYAEADPSADIDGDDVRRKLVISVAAAFGALVREQDVPMFGIRTITARDVANFRALGKTCKLIASAEAGKTVSASVEPVLYSAGTPESAIPENFNLVSFESTNAGHQSYYGQGAGRYPTAYNMVQDCLDVRSGTRRFYTKDFVRAEVDNTNVFRHYYVRTNAEDAWLDSVAAAKGDGFAVTAAISQAKFHEWAAVQRQSDPTLFFAALQ
ncbi:MAG: homoserine dehydrogenase [Oscillospiraceae bacterium]|nr:homoserine dehydrogenase [Oscillospiraceae bacterium]